MTALPPLPPADLSRLDTAENRREAAAGFEAIFAGMMVKAMRTPSLGETLLDNDGARLFRSRLDGEFASAFGARGSLGLGQAMLDAIGKGPR